MRILIIGGMVMVSAALVGLQSGCGSSQELRSGYRVPASEGTVSATEGDNGNTMLQVRVKHLARPSQMASEATVYVVWVKPLDGDSQNVGALTLNDNLEGSLDTVTPHRQFKLSVTPEPSGQVAAPSRQPVFTADVVRSN